MRNPLTYWGSVALLVIIVVAFIFFGPVVGQGGAGSLGQYGSYDGVEIAAVPNSYFMDRAQQISAQVPGMTGDMEQAIFQQAFHDTYVHLALLSIGQSLNIGLSDNALNKRMATVPKWFDDAGRFSPTKYQLSGPAEQQAVARSLREETIHNYVLQNVVATIPLSKSEKELLKSTYINQRKLSVVAFSKDDFPPAELVAYAKANPKLFQRLSLSSITVSTKDKADQIRKQLAQKTATFEDLAKSQSEDQSTKEKGGKRDLLYFHQIQAIYPQADAAESIRNLKAGDYSDVIADAGRFTIFRGDALPADPDYEAREFLENTRGYLFQHEKGKIDDYLIAQAKNFRDLSLPVGLVEYAKARQRPTLETNFFPISVSKKFDGKDQLGTVSTATYDSIGDAQDKDQFFETAFTLKRGQISDPIVLSDRVILISLKDEQKLTGEQEKKLDTSIESIGQDFWVKEIEQVVVDKKKLKDNFAHAYAQSRQQ